jgi:nucleoside-diphosphate-sugar epimerase
MIKPRIIVTGATGKTSSIVVAELLKAGYPVRALVHRQDQRREHLRAQGAEIAVADMCDVERVADALKTCSAPTIVRLSSRTCSRVRSLSWSPPRKPGSSTSSA